MTLADGDQVRRCVLCLPEYDVLLSGYEGERCRINNAVITRPSSYDAGDVRMAYGLEWKNEAICSASRSAVEDESTTARHG